VAIAVVPWGKNLVLDFGKDGVLIPIAAVQKMGKPVLRAGKKADLVAVAVAAKQKEKRLAVLVEVEKQHVLPPFLCCGLPC
jgi:hypothetical protein